MYIYIYNLRLEISNKIQPFGRKDGQLDNAANKALNHFQNVSKKKAKTQ